MPPTTREHFADDLGRVVEASHKAGETRAALVTTLDREYAVAGIKQVVASAGSNLYHFTVSGRRRWNSEHLRWEPVGGTNAVDAHELLRCAYELRGGGVVILEDVVPLLRDDNGDLRARDVLRTMLSVETSNDGLVLAFVEPPSAEGALPAILADRFVRLEVPYPRREDLSAIAREEIAKAVQQRQQPTDADTIKETAERLGSALVGLTRRAARDAIRDALAPDTLDFDAAHERLQRRKAQQLHRELSMEVLNTNHVDYPIGVPYLVEYLQLQVPRMNETGSDRPRGILLLGPPGTGKSHFAKAVGAVMGHPEVAFNISSLMNSFLGETERRFAQAFATLEAMAPVICWMDEIERAFGESSERDNGTMQRCKGHLLTWLSENPHPVYIVATCNSLKRMGEIGLTMTRSERFDQAFFLDVPCLDARREMLERWLAPMMPDADPVAEELAPITEKFSGADLRSVVKTVATRAAYSEEPVTMELVKSEIEKKRMRALGLYDEFMDLRRWARMHCEPAGPTDD